MSGELGFFDGHKNRLYLMRLQYRCPRSNSYAVVDCKADQDRISYDSLASVLPVVVLVVLVVEAEVVTTTFIFKAGIALVTNGRQCPCRREKTVVCMQDKSLFSN